MGEITLTLSNSPLRGWDSLARIAELTAVQTVAADPDSESAVGPLGKHEAPCPKSRLISVKEPNPEQKRKVINAEAECKRLSLQKKTGSKLIQILIHLSSSTSALFTTYNRLCSVLAQHFPFPFE